MKHRMPGAIRALLITLPVLAWGCSSGGSGSNTASQGFLENETQVDHGGAQDATDPAIYADGQRVYVLFVDRRNGVEELFLNRSDDGGKNWLAQDVLIPGDPNGPLGVDPAGRKLAFDGDDVVVVFEESDDMFSNVSHDGGLTWNASATRLDPGGINAFDSDDPTVLFGNGKFYAVWEDEPDGDADAYFARSDDLGDTWTTAVQVNASAPGAFPSDYLWMAVTDTGAVYVAWADDRNDPGGAESVFFQSSTDDGATWRMADVQVDEGLGDVADLEIEASGSTVYAAWRDDRTGDYGVYFQRSLDGGDTWAANDSRLDTTPAGTSNEEVDLRADGDLVVVGWKANGAGVGDDLFVTVSQDGGVTWLPAPLRLDQDPPGAGDSDDLQLAVSGQTIVAAWEDTSQGLDDIFVRYSKDAGATWSESLFAEETAAGSSDASQPSLVLSGSSAWVAWHDDRSGDLGVFVNGGPLP